jgi:hypothetical protein
MKAMYDSGLLGDFKSLDGVKLLKKVGRHATWVEEIKKLVRKMPCMCFFILVSL